MEHAWRIIVQLDSNAVSLLDHMAVGHNIAFGINQHSRTEGALTNGAATRATTTRAAEKPVKEIVERILIVRTVRAVRTATGRSTAATLWRLDSRFGIDVDHAGLKLF